MNKYDKIYIAGHRGMVGSAILRKLKADGFTNFILKTSTELNLINQQDVNDFFATEKPTYVFLAAAKVGGILANNTYRADFIYQNLMIESNIIHAAYVNKVTKLLFLGSSCIYPKMALQPLKEEYLLTNTLEYTNEPYAIAKIAGIKMCEAYRNQYNCNFISAMPTNLYGPNDNYDLKNSHVLPALIRKFHTAKINGDNTVELWGTGSPMREFLHVDDLAEACIFLMQNYHEEQFVNIGTGTDITIKDLALLIKEIVGFSGKLTFDYTKPDGTPKKLLDVTKINQLGWRHKITLHEGIKKVYEEVKKFDFQTSLR
ncbi:MAG: GDP-fucose synthetase [Flavobacteriales bacterium CG_4_10_14_0_2_um_filter_32_8]|nr:MAG: GDP-fucose synthetase [Flavobacteriales bacterium CG_4_10_14_0_2_um_filter_32_8]PJB13869.1 MAG: GDP-fucose synthetase [Flavobacteriales bacterium CG_4_9_14_3_um_filter_32_8]